MKHSQRVNQRGSEVSLGPGARPSLNEQISSPLKGED